MAKPRRNKGLVVEFDEAKRRDFLTGFRKRKKQRQKAGAIQKQDKERKKRLAARHERRLLRDQALGLKEDQSPEEKSEELEDEQDDDGDDDTGKGDTVVYEDDQIKTVVKTCAIEDNTVVDLKPSSKGTKRKDRDTKLKRKL